METIIITRVPLRSQMGGEEIHTMAVANYLREQGYKVVFATRCKVLNKLAKENNFSHIWLKDFPSSPTTKLALAWFALIFPFALFGSLIMWVFFRLRFGKATYYMLNLSDKILFGFWIKIFGGKAVCIEHATIGAWLSKNPFLRTYKWILSSNRIKIVSVSRAMKYELEKTLMLPCHDIANGIELERLSSVDTLDTDRDPNQILFVGRLEADKGFDKVMNIAKNNPNLNFVVFGSGSMESMAKGISNLKLKGFVDHKELKKWYRNSQMLLLPATKMDPFALVVPEALNQGCVVMCSNLVGASDYLNSDFVCDINDFEQEFDLYYKRSFQLQQKAYNKSLEFDQKDMFADYLRLLKAL